MTSREKPGSREAGAPQDPGLSTRLALLDELRHAEIRAASSQVASMIGHMIGTPLNVIVGRAALLRASPNAEGMIDHARRIEEQAQRMAERFQRFIHYLTIPESASEARSARAVLHDALALYAPIADQRGIVLLTPEEHLPEVSVEGTPALIVLGSLLSFAIRTTLTGQTVRVMVDHANPEVRFGIWLPTLPTIQGKFDRLEPPDHYDPSSVESEQALAICAAIAKRGGGRLELKQDGAGTGATIWSCWRDLRAP